MAPERSTSFRSAPINRATTGFLHLETRSKILGNTVSPGLREMRAMYSVSGSASNASIPMSIMIPPT